MYARADNASALSWATVGATDAGVFAPPKTNGEHNTGWFLLQKALIAPSIVSSQTKGEFPLQFPVTTG